MSERLEGRTDVEVKKPITPDTPVQFIWTFTPQQVRTYKRRLLFGAFLSALAWCVAEFLAARGFVSLHLSQVFLYVASALLWLLLCLWIMGKWARFCTVIVVLLLALAIDRYTPRPPARVDGLASNERESSPRPVATDNSGSAEPARPAQEDQPAQPAHQPTKTVSSSQKPKSPFKTGPQGQATDSPTASIHDNTFIATPTPDPKCPRLTNDQMEAGNEALSECQKQHPEEVNRQIFRRELLGCLNEELRKMPNNFEALYHPMPPAPGTVGVQLNGNARGNVHDNDFNAQVGAVANDNARLEYHQNRQNVDREWISLYSLCVAKK